ncbi:nuclear factor related to kappa-B-binding protein isoform X2 [Episyrphus balteatus]|nr:nuclear factor related to kappa-B-binding protein isoform X2 [Episyrphus balteatus]
MTGSYKRVFASGKTPGRKPKAKLLQEKTEKAPLEEKIEVKEELPTSPAPLVTPPNHHLSQIQTAPDRIYVEQPIHQQHNVAIAPPQELEQKTVEQPPSQDSEEDEVVNVETIETTSMCQLPSINGSDFVHSEEVIIPMTEIKAEDPPESTIPSPPKLTSYHGKIKIATFSDLKGIDVMNIPMDMDDSCLSEADFNSHPEPIISQVQQPVASVNTIKSFVAASSPELMQETHACFLSLIRDIFCSTPNHRMKLDDLREKIHAWLSNPITALNDWYCLAENWSSLVTSAINFLAGDFSDQPEEYVPYIEYKSQLNIYQWIGASRDSDTHLVQLCNYWMSRKHEMTHKPIQKADMTPRKSIDFDENGSNEIAASPPLPRCPTQWAVQPSSTEEMLEFQRQERERFENPHRSFTYRMHGYESVVGPVKGIYTQIFALTKARGHSMMIGDRPSFVTILTLVRDATARLPNGEGTRADISELLKCSQYINREAPENVLQTIVSGALDRMHTEHDPCVRYDTKKKIWIYLHRNRSEEEFERMHQQYQGIGKHKKPANRKVKAKIIIKENVSIASPTAPSSSLPVLMPSNPIIINSSSNAQKNTQSQSLKTVLKPELISEDKIEVMETQEISTLDDALSPGAVPQVQPQQQQQQRQQTQFISQKMFAATTSSTPSQQQQQQTKKTSPTPIIVATPTGIQTVHVSAANNPTLITIPTSSTCSTSPENKQPVPNPTIVFPATQQIITTNQQSQQQQISVANKKISLSKPIIINQAVATGQQQIRPQQQQQPHQQQQGFIIPININNSEQFKVMGNSILLTDQQKSNVNPTTTTTFMQQQSPKNIVRLAGGKSLLSPQLNKVQTQSVQKVPTITTTAVRPQLQKTIGGISLINNATVGGVRMSSQALTNLQQKQIIQSFLNQQGNKQRLVIGNLGTVIPQQQQQQLLQNKNVIIQQTSQAQKLVNATTPTVVPSTATNTGTGTIISTSTQGGNIIGSPIFQIHSAPTTPGGTTKIQTISASSLTPQQQQNLLQNLKQPQFKSVQGCQLVSTQQQSLIIKQQPIFSTQQQQQQQNTSQQQKNLNTNQQQQISTGTMTAVSVGSASPKAVVVSGVGNIITTAPSNITQNIIKHPTLQLQQNLGKPITVVSQPQNITRLIKSGNVQNQIISRAGLRAQSVNPVMAKVLTNTSGQIISLESLLQKQGATLRVTNAKPSQTTNLIQLAGTAGSQITQYAVVSQGRNLFSMSGQQQPARLISTQASSSTVSTTTTPASPASKPVVSSTPAKLISTNQITAQQLVNAKFLSKGSNVATTSAGGIRMINTQNFNIANIQGKPVIIASKQGGANINQQQLGHQQAAGTGTSVVIGGQTLKLQGNVISTSNVQLINKAISSVASSATTSTVMMGNQILKVQQSTPLKQGAVAATTTPLTTIASTNTGTVVVNSNSVLNHQNMPTKTVVLGSTGQAIRVQTPSQMHGVNVSGSVGGLKNVTSTSIAQGTTMKSSANRVVLAVQGGGQIFLSPNFQGGAINLKSLQGMKVVSLAQQPHLQQQSSQPQQIQQQTQTTPQQQQQQGKSKSLPK